MHKQRYDSSASTSPKVAEMATAEMCNSPISTETSGHSFDANQDEMMEKSTQEWNEQLEKEFFSVLNDLDDQLAQEQAQDPLDRTASTSTASNAQYSSAFPTSKRQTASRGQHRTDWSDMPSTFFPDGLRTIRAKDEHKIFIRPRKLYNAYINWNQAALQEDYKYNDPVDGNPHRLSSRLSSVSFGRSSEGSLYPPSVTQNSGFRHKSCMNRETAGRSYSVCSLRRCPSSVSSDQLSASSLQHTLSRESSNGFVPRFGRQNPKRIPLSSIVWNNTPDSPRQTPTQEKMFRTQSLMEFHATDHGRYPSSLQETKKYACYHSKHHYRRSISSSNCFSRVSCPDKATSPLPFDNWENYPLYKSENNLSRSYCRDTSSHGKLYANQKHSLYGKKDSYPSWADIPQYYNDKVFISPDASFEVIMANLNDQQWAHTKNAKFGSQHLQNDFHVYSPENTNIKRITRSANRTFSEFIEGCQPWLSCNSSVSSSSIRTDESIFPNLKDQTKPIGLNKNSVIVTQRSTKADFTQLEKVKDMKPPDEDMPLQSVSQQADMNYINAQSFSSNSPASAMLQSDASLFNTLGSKRQTQVTAREDIAKMYTSNGDKRNVQMKENDCPPNSVFSQPPCILPADESRKEPFLSNQKEWEHNMHYAAKRESIKQDNQSAEAGTRATPKRQSSLLNVASAPSTEKLANCQGTLSCPPECSSSSSQSSLQALSHKDNSKCLGTLTSSSVNCTESQAEGGKTAPNDGSATSLEVDMSFDSLISTDSQQPFLQLDNENQNHSPDPDRNMPRPRTAESKTTENQSDPSLLVNNSNWRSFTSSYTQKEAISPKKTTVKVENRPSLTTLFPDKAVATRNKNSQTLGLRLENRSQHISPSATTSDLLDDEKRRASSHACSPPLPLLTDKNSNTYVNSCLQADICPEQNLTSQTLLGQCQNTSRSASLKNANLYSYQLRKSHAKSQRERHLSESICARDSYETFASGSSVLPKDGIHGKRFKSYSELLSYDENENWASDDEKCCSTRNLMYPSVEFGIFGKEQQLAFLENIKRSLTEGRLWRPCLLNNPGALRDGDPPSINRAELLSSSSAGSKMSSTASSPREPTDIYQEDPAAYSDSDSDTTTDDEYYLDEIDKESEL
ncbi:exophilin-5 [Grus japonensis]|uniref:Exophilin-5 n=1 Tax=Grus japonensis TaxID=30415 RepID=A0ABC9W4R1_GRUJA